MDKTKTTIDTKKLERFMIEELKELPFGKEISSVRVALTIPKVYPENYQKSAVAIHQDSDGTFYIFQVKGDKYVYLDRERYG